MNMKRSSENDEQLSSARKIPKLLAHGLKVESQDFSPTATMPNTKLFNQVCIIFLLNFSIKSRFI